MKNKYSLDDFISIFKNKYLTNHLWLKDKIPQICLTMYMCASEPQENFTSELSGTNSI